MKNISLLAFIFSGLMISSCGNGSPAPVSPVDSAKATPSSSIDSAANNSVLPPSSAAGNANNSSVADTTYKSKPKLKDSVKK